MTLTEFLADFQIALANGFGRADSVIKMNTILNELNHHFLQARHIGAEFILLESLENTIESIINES